MLESLSNKFAVSVNIAKLLGTPFEEHQRTAASGILKIMITCKLNYFSSF